MKIFDIEENDANQRLDKFLKKLFPAATRSLIYKFNRKWKIKVLNKWADWFKKRDNEYKIEIWDKIKMFLSDKDFEELRILPEPKDLGIITKFDKNNIVYEDDELLVINKNSWINVHPWDHKTKESNVISMIQDYLWDKLNSLTFKPSLIHRIDRDTSGILMIAKKKDILVKLVNDFKSHEKVQKKYYAIVVWKLSRKKWTIKKNLLRIENAKNESKVRVDEKGQTAITHYKSLKEHIIRTKEDILILTEVEIEIETGRMHQIRVHMASLWNPVLWDKSYWDKRLNSFFSRNFWLQRQALHAWKIKFNHYGIDKKMNLTANIKDDIKDFIKKLKS